jgi:Tol biopolymer transport system component
VATRFSERSPALSPDGRWLAYASDESGKDEVYVRAFPIPSGRWQISGAGGIEPRWAPSGREIFYRNADTLIRVAVATQPAFATGTRSPVFIRADFSDPQHATWDVSPDGQQFAFVRADREAASLVLTLNWFEELRRRVR